MDQPPVQRGETFRFNVRLDGVWRTIAYHGGIRSSDAADALARLDEWGHHLPIRVVSNHTNQVHDPG